MIRLVSACIIVLVIVPSIAAAEDRSGQYVLTRTTRPAKVGKTDAASWKAKTRKQKAAKAGRRTMDCEGYAYMTQNVLGGSCR